MADKGTRKTRVFVSYSHGDSDFADRLVMELQRSELEVLIDKKDLNLGERWKQELSDFVFRADAIVFVASPRSVQSDWCAWELAQVVEFKKRLFPVLSEWVDWVELPPLLREIQVLSFTPPNDFFVQLHKLINALQTDVDWLKERTWLDEWARRWQRRGKSSALSLRDGELRAALEWRRGQPKSANQLDLSKEFLRISELYSRRRSEVFKFALSGVFVLPFLAIAVLTLQEMGWSSIGWAHYYMAAWTNDPPFLLLGLVALTIYALLAAVFVRSILFFRAVRDYKLLGLAVVFLLFAFLWGSRGQCS